MDEAEKQGIALQRAISDRIRKLRREKGWPLDKLAGIAGLSKGYLSQIENGEKNPPIGTLTKIAFGLGVDVIYLITGENRRTTDPSKCSIIRANQRKPIIHRGAPRGYRYESITYNKTDRLMDAYIITVGPEPPKEPLRHEGQEIVFALEGRHEFNYDDRKIEVGPGDCLCFDSDRPHFSRSLGSKAARVLVVFSAPQKTE
jgi:transcriptional regulator with XRE-family HTH domain